jgi:hypothetical protein
VENESGGLQIPPNSTRYGYGEIIDQITTVRKHLVVCCAFDMKGGNPPPLSFWWILFYYSGNDHIVAMPQQRRRKNVYAKISGG